MNRLVSSKQPARYLIDAVNFVVRDNEAVIRLLRKSDLTEAKHTSELLQTTMLSGVSSHYQMNSTVSVIDDDDKTIYSIAAELKFAPDSRKDHAVTPLANYLFVITDGVLKVVNYQLETAFTHYRVPEYLNSLGYTTMCFAQAYTVNAHDSISKANFSVLDIPNVKLITNLEFDDINEIDEVVNSNIRRKLQATLKLESETKELAAEDKALITVSCVLDDKLVDTADFVVHLEDIVGYLPKKRVQLDHGKASFYAYASKLAVSDSLRIKAGLSFYKGLAEINIPITKEAVVSESAAVSTGITQQEVAEMINASMNSAIELLSSSMPNNQIEALQNDVSQRLEAALLDFNAVADSLRTRIDSLEAKQNS